MKIMLNDKVIPDYSIAGYTQLLDKKWHSGTIIKNRLDYYMIIVEDGKYVRYSLLNLNTGKIIGSEDSIDKLYKSYAESDDEIVTGRMLLMDRG